MAIAFASVDFLCR